jgi:hypothetical protein
MPAEKPFAGIGRETNEGYVAGDFEAPDVSDYVVAELRYETPVAYTASHFTAPAPAAPQADGLNDILGRFDIKRIRSQFGLNPSTVRLRVEVAAVLPPEPHAATYPGKCAIAPSASACWSCPRTILPVRRCREFSRLR